MPRRSRNDPIPQERAVNYCFSCHRILHSTRGCVNHNLDLHIHLTHDCATCGTAFRSVALLHQHRQDYHVSNAVTDIRCNICATFSENGSQNCRVCGNVLPPQPQPQPQGN